MTKPEKPSDFDWVNARAGCSALNMFQLLKDDALKNIDAIKAVTKLNGDEMPVKFFDNGHFFGVIRPYQRFTEIGVKFRLSQDEIRVESQGLEVGFTATLTLNDQGECRFLVAGETLDRWQVLRRALEPLFFVAAERYLPLSLAPPLSGGMLSDVAAFFRRELRQPSCGGL